MWKQVGRLSPKQRGELIEQIKEFGPYKLARIDDVYEIMTEKGIISSLLSARRCSCGHVQLLSRQDIEIQCEECGEFGEVDNESFF